VNVEPIGRLIVAILILLGVGCAQNSIPSDKAMIAIFHAHQVEFERIKDLATEDKGRFSYISATEDAGQLSVERKQEYRESLASIQPGLVMTSSRGDVRIIFASGGESAIGPGWLKGITFIPGDVGTEGQLANSLDNVPELPTGEVYLRPVSPNWFLIVQKTD
jgi:hypothetical protein